jgi:UDP-N-acetylmuramoyl-L-alanyl-D-glutamate--2,6-diaminopimelate ligase
MKFKQLIKVLGSLFDREDFEVKGVSPNSKNVQDGFIFVAISGTHDDGHEFIDEAIKRGAKAIVVESSKLKTQRLLKVPFIAVGDTRKALAQLSARFYGSPSRKIKVVGITGTNGKTTITYLIEALLKEAGFNPAVIGTVNYRFKDKIIPSKNTTPGPVELQSMLSEMLSNEVDYVIMEVSSHALDQQRVEGINFHCAIFTNLTQDHLDYHATMEKYFSAKAKLFKNLDPGAYAVINNDDAYAHRIKELTKAKIITYGIDNRSDISATKMQFSMNYTKFSVSSQKQDFNIKSRLIGRHNVYNILSGVAFALEEGINPEVIKNAIEKFSLVPGRLERIESDAGFAVFVDYAHTEDALTNAINTLRPLSGNRVIVVFGCGGDRDKTKRPKMGRAATELADYAIITNDNPRSEDPQAIIDGIRKGIKKENFCVIPQRMQAIRRSLEMAKTGDIVLVAGKGHESYQILSNRTEYFDDRQAVRECLRSLKL